MEENNIDNYFKDRLDSHVESPSDDVWERLDAQLSGEKDNKASGTQWRTMALLSLGLLLLISGLFFWRMDRLDKENEALELALSEERLASEQTVDGSGENRALQNQDMEDSYVVLDGESAIVQYENQHVTTGIEAQEKERRTIQDKSQSAPTDFEQQGKAAPVAIGSAANLGTSDRPDKRDKNTLADKKGTAGALGSATLAGQTSSTKTPDITGARTTEPIGTFETSPLVIDANPTAIQEEKKDAQGSKGVLEQNPSTRMVSDSNESGPIEPITYLPVELGSLFSHTSHHGIDSTWTPCTGILFMTDSKWSVGLAAYQNKTFRRIRTQSPESKQLRNSLDRAEEASNSIGMRGYVGYRLGKRMSLTLGLDYSQWRQDGSYRVNYDLPDPGDISLNPEPSTFESELVTSTSTNDVVIQATYDPGVETWVGFGSSNSVQVDRKEDITLLSIPLSLRYQTYLGRFGLQGGAGLAYDLILNSSSETTISGDFDSSSISNTTVQKDGFISAQAEVGLFYRFSERNKIHIGPRFKSWLVPLYENDGLRTYPYSNAIEVGIEIGL